MNILFLGLAAASLATMSEAENGQFYSAIWADLRLNALIGNGNWRASLWYNAGDSDIPNLHIQQLKCARADSGQRCSFVLFRDGGPVTVLDETAPDKLNCKAFLVRDSDGWSVVHTPPRRAGHSRTSMRCKVLAE